MTLRVTHCNRSSVKGTQNDVDVFVVLGRLINEWADDPDLLAVAAWAYECVLGYNDAAVEIRGLRHDEAQEVVRRAVYRRNRKTLQHRAEGLVLALRAVAGDAQFAHLHRVRLGAAVIECRELTIDERVAKLRETSADA